MLTAAKLIGEIAGVERFATDAKLARTAGSAPIPASSGNTDRHRLDRGGNRQLNCALHRLAVSKGRLDPETAAYLARKQAEGKTRREALRCLKRHLARRVWHLLQPPPPSSTLPTAIGDRPPVIAKAGRDDPLQRACGHPGLDIGATTDQLARFALAALDGAFVASQADPTVTLERAPPNHSRPRSSRLGARCWPRHVSSARRRSHELCDAVSPGGAHYLSGETGSQPRQGAP